MGEEERDRIEKEEKFDVVPMRCVFSRVCVCAIKMFAIECVLVTGG